MIKERDSILKEALKKRQRQSLSSNFSHRMMNEIYDEEIKIKRKSMQITYFLMAFAISIILTGGILGIYLYADFSFISLVDKFKQVIYSGNISFYIYIFIPMLILLFLDDRLRKWYWKHKFK